MPQLIGAIPWNKGKFELHKCKGCNKQLRKWQTFCSHLCYRKSKTHILLYKTCVTCNKDFKLRLSQKKFKNCSIQCAKIAIGKAKRGVNHPLYKKHRSEETKRKISMSKQHIKNIQEWHGFKGTQDKRARVLFRTTMQKKIFERDNYQCVLCKSREDLQVDHIQKWSEYEDLRFEETNCRTLCVR